MNWISGEKLETWNLRCLYCGVLIESLVANILNDANQTLWITWKLPRSVSTGGHCKFAVRQRICVGSPHYLKRACWYTKSVTCKVCVCRVRKCSQCRVVWCHLQLRLRWCNAWAPGSFFISMFVCSFLINRSSHVKRFLFFLHILIYSYSRKVKVPQSY